MVKNVNTSTLADVHAAETEASMETTPMKVHPALFLLFAEFLGYVSPFIEWAEKACTKGIEDYQKKILKMDSFTIFERMKKEFDVKTIKEHWDSLHDVAIKKYETKLKDIEAIENLPF